MARPKAKRAMPRNAANRDKAKRTRPRAAGGGTAQQPPVPTSTPSYQLNIRFGNREEDSITIETDDRRFYPISEEWSYVVANRRRITDDSRATLSARLFWQLAKLTPNLSHDALRERIAAMPRAGLVEVEIPFEAEQVGWAARVFPWESVLALVTKPYRGDKLITVVRYLRTKQPRTRPADVDPSSRRRGSGPPLLVVRSGPGALGKMFALDAEARLVLNTLRMLTGPGPAEDALLPEPDYDALQQRVRAQSPSVIHLAGVDPLALKWNKLDDAAAQENTDGFVLRDPAGKGYDRVDPLRLATALKGGEVCPHLVSISTCFSAPRVAAMAVGEGGARHAIGFQDVISDDDATFFFGAFYPLWADNGWSIVDAFKQARDQVARQAGATPAAGAVLWSDHSLLPASEPRAADAGRASAGSVRSRRGPARPPAVVKPTDTRGTKDTAGTTPAADPRELKVHIVPVADLNYSLLHNNRDVFTTFFVEKPRGLLPPLEIEVVLEAGIGTCRCRFAAPLPEQAIPTRLSERVRLPLVADLLRQCTESLRSNLYVRIGCGDALVYEETHRVTILPADEWRDDGQDHCWLPSFVLPRDPAVLTVITAAQRYLRTLLDDCGAGFDGYQQVRSDDANAADVIDPQVQAIWAALQHDLPLAYINPPPAYSSQSQRLRSPTQVFEGKAATCIDLALLFASCLEFVGIYPVIFLITGHAFPGYWRSDRAWRQMREFKTKDEDGAEAAAGASDATLIVARGQGEGWMLERGNLRELLGFVEAGLLVPFESTYVTRNRGFFEALATGPGNLAPDSFDVMLDVQLARAEHITPLPLVQKG